MAGQLFEENLKLYSRYNLENAEKIKNASCSGYLFTKTDAGELNVMKEREKMPFHSESGALKEALEWVEALPLERVCHLAVFGLGLGYQFEVLFPWLKADQNRMLIIFEDDLALLHRFFETERATRLLLHPQVIIKVLSPLEGNFSTRFSEECRDVISALFHTGLFFTASPIYVKQRREVVELLRSQVIVHTSYERAYQYELTHARDVVFPSFYANMLHIAGWPLQKQMEGALSGLPAIICGAGPSITREMERLKQLQEHALIFGAGTGMNVLNANGVIPHFGVGVDPTEAQGSRLKTNYAYEVPYFIRTRFNSSARHTVHGPKIYVNGLANYLVADWFEERLGISGEKELPSGVSSSNFAIELAAFLGCSPIILVGMDLAYTDGSRYPQGVRAHPAEPRKRHEELSKQAMQKVVSKTVLGERINTKYDWLLEADIITDTKLRFPSTAFYNATYGGLEIKEVPFLPFEEVVSKYLNTSYPIESMIHRLIYEVERVPDDQKLLEKTMAEWITSLTHAEALYQALKEELKKLWDAVLKGEKFQKSHLMNSLEEKLKKEPVYSYLLVDYDPLFESLAFKEKYRLSCHFDYLTDQQIDCKRLEILLNQYLFCEEKTKFHKVLALKALENESGREREAEQKNRGKADPLPKMEEGLEPLIMRYSSGQIASMTAYKNGKKQGIHSFYYPNGRLESIRPYKGGRRHGVQEYYYPDGRCKSQLPYNEGSLNGQVMLYYASGVPFREIHFLGGELSGVEKEWNQQGVLICLANYHKGRAVEVAKRWHSNGKLAQEMHFYGEEGLYNLTLWDEEGRLILQEAAKKEGIYQNKKESVEEALLRFSQETIQMGRLDDDDIFHLKGDE